MTDGFATRKGGKTRRDEKWSEDRQRQGGNREPGHVHGLGRVYWLVDAGEASVEEESDLGQWVNETLIDLEGEVQTQQEGERLRL